jgi:hypothetical protein
MHAKNQVELLRWEGEDLSPDRDGTITKSIVVAGEKFNCPSEHAPIKGLFSLTNICQYHKKSNTWGLILNSCSSPCCWF